MIRKMIILVLDDGEGVSEKTYEQIKKVCKRNKWTDILAWVRETEGRYYLPSNHGLE